jgi:hypothetical protein
MNRTVRSFLAELSPLWLRRRTTKRMGLVPMPAMPEDVIRAKTIIPVSAATVDGPGGRPPRPEPKM